MTRQDYQHLYTAAIYTIATEPSLQLRIGVPTPGLGNLYQQTGCQSAALITAFNPYSQRLTRAENLARHQQLTEMVRWCARPYWPATNQDPTGDWPDEQSFLILGLSWAQARALGLGFAQHAVVWVERDTRPQLLWCESPTDRCETCGRQVPLTFHHLIPKKLHRRPRFKKRYTPAELQAGIYVCRTCHTGIHRQFDEMTLGRHYASLLALHLQPDLQRHFQWAAKQKRQR